jgi:hypothetical protein
MPGSTSLGPHLGFCGRPSPPPNHKVRSRSIWDARQDKNEGLLAFKNNWAPGNRPLNYWRGPAGSSSEITEGWKLGLAKRVFSHLPHGLLVMSGKLMYRHIG